MKTFALILLLVFSGEPHEKELPLASAKLRVEGITSIQGNLGILVFNSSLGFPSKADEAILNLKVKVESETMEIDLGELPTGSYAFAILHDKNSNKVMDKGLLGIPKEPFGFSNTDKIPFGAPSFQDAKVLINEENRIITIRLLEI
ncbi:MAG: DUF2141 domain-containing protein [Flavobacteriales bacterium]|nr:DUF2141 domain-containing protein [Flavobacteriales bacterium]